MDKFVVEGGHVLEGPLHVSGSKNTALPLMAAALMAEGTTTITNVPVLRDISTFSQVMRVCGAEIDVDKEAHTLKIDGSNITTYEAPYELVKKMRASFYMLGALLGRFGEARVSLPGGCAWGPRPVDLHLKGMRELGAELDLNEGYVEAHAPNGRLQGGSFRFEPSSVGATINVVLAAVLADGTTRLENAAVEPDVVVFTRALEKMGAKIQGIGTRTLTIEGVDRLEPSTVENSPDRIELGTFMILAALVGSPDTPVTITGGNTGHLGQIFMDAFRETGAQVADDGRRVRVAPPDTIQPVSIETDVYPGFPTDLQAQWTVLMTQADGNSSVTDTIYHDRFKHVPELQRMGADIEVKENIAQIEGHTQLKGAQVMSTDLRASVSLVMAGTVARGTTDVLRVYHLDRGYENLEQKLQAAGLSVHREPYDEFKQPVPHIVK
jgi:UDP-N-acetylglucosamine 1-carboxyvinyltransferase